MAAANDISVALFHRNKADRFHWAITISVSPIVVVKFHARNTAGGFWSYQTDEQEISDSLGLVALVKIGSLSATRKTVADVDELLESLDMATSRQDGGRSVKFDCVIWVRQAVRALDVNGFLHCTDVLALEKECQEVATKWAPSVMTGDASYIVHVSEHAAGVA